MSTANRRPDAKLIGVSSAMKELRQKIMQVGPTELPVLLIGETGTGKEVVARALHDASGRKGQFVPVDCAAISKMLVESELFGHERGSFTGANRTREGLVHTARGGTLFFDELAELPVESQTRLLRLLQEGTYRRVGSENERKADIRVIAATWQDLGQRMVDGLFRVDLYHRLGIVEIRLPPLRKRREDILMLLQHFLRETAPDRGFELDPLAKHHLLTWPWPGNVRELRNTALYIGALCEQDVVKMDDLPLQLLREPPAVRQDVRFLPIVRTDLPYMDARRLWLDEFQFRYISAHLDANDGNISATARAIGVDRRSIQRILAGFREMDGDKSAPRGLRLLKPVTCQRNVKGP